MQKFIAFMEKYIVPVAGKIGSQRHLAAIRDGFIAVMPLILVGSMAILVNGLPIPAFQDFMKDLFGETWKQIGGGMWTGSFGVLALMVAVTTSYNLAKSYGVDGLSAGLISFGALIIFTPTTPKEGGLSFLWTGAQGLFVSLIVAIFVTEAFRFFVQRNFTIKMPEGVPPAVMKSFAALVPAFVILTLVASIQLAVKLSGTSVHEFIFNTLQVPLQGLVGTLPSAIVIALLLHLLWFFGLHGPNIVGGIIEPLYLPALEKNISLFQSGTSAFEVPNIVTKPFFDTFVYLGGSGATLAFLVVILIIAKSAQLRGVSRLSLGPSAFNINEPVIFGTPIVLNPILFIPFILTPVILVITSYTAIYFGWVPKTVAMVPWNVPPIISGYLVTGGHISGAILQIFNFILAMIIYFPFVVACDRSVIRTEKAAQGNNNSVPM
ncbi:PTS system, cellobiose-specific IIC component [Bacillus thuringiensis serovar andalousiensis]|jgi:PTS system cellobiose-specific IIC component|uniref:Permease IIC component n=2 Tax=Bacillus cereus group TaxID=86661 RepID=A0A9X6Q3A4_BACTU|nr:MULTISPECIES: PTS cellobiose transporter subunit IIC [Bacillus]EEL62614.1 PTS system, lactose/cellobiose family IIC subunit [Bacillus cereus F65185]MDA2614022.1 PTS cellobiose transporter subunit IIC [Bacillus cereus]MDR4438002.1 PTS cellobiose transporter subunit IIC [Bacillus cereus]MDR5045516.1 PTS cellobiose transporter subunit IIC [Bacillus thuringiensis]MEB8554158.1 PTS cellobiose transporter subunit IIC [Bacillus cereus]